MVTESGTIGFDIGFKLTLTYGFICAKSVVDKNPKATFMKETILTKQLLNVLKPWREWGIKHV